MIKPPTAQPIAMPATAPVPSPLPVAETAAAVDDELTPAGLVESVGVERICDELGVVVGCLDDV